MSLGSGQTQPIALYGIRATHAGTVPVDSPATYKHVSAAVDRYGRWIRSRERSVDLRLAGGRGAKIRDAINAAVCADRGSEIHDKDISTASDHRNANRINEPRGNQALRVAVSRRRFLVYIAGTGVGNIDISAAVHHQARGKGPA